MKKLLVTGGAGFIGSNFIKFILKKYPDWEVTNFDKLTYAGNLENLKEVEGNPNYKFIKGDIANKDQVNNVMQEGFDYLVNFAAESHVDRSILDLSPFIDTNIKGTQILLEGIRQYSVERYIQISTDEVYGSIQESKAKEDYPLLPNNPYSSSKASADLLCRAYQKTYNLPIIITRSTNNYGPYQFPEKLIPLVITNALEDKEIPIYGDGQYIRDWIYVEDHCIAIDEVLQNGESGEIYNIGGDNERTNLELVELILKIMEKPLSLIKFITDRPGHDRRYAVDTSKIEKEMGWKPGIDFLKGIMETTDWYEENKNWWLNIKSGEYTNYYQAWYSQK